MKNKKVVFAAPNQVELGEEEIDQGALETNQVLVKKDYSLISAGTELACLAGIEWWFPLPNTPGYTSVGEIVAKSDDVEGFEIGDKVYQFGKHCQYEAFSLDDSQMMLKVPEGLDLRYVPFTRIASIAMTSIRTSNIELSDVVAVSGLGLVGMMAAQLAKAQGAKVIGIDPLAGRRELARKVGIDYCIDPINEDQREVIMEITGGKGVETLIEATGAPKVALEAVKLVKQLGEAVFLGSFRGEYQSNVTELLNQCHLFDNGCVTFKGAHEWRYPVNVTPFSKHSMARNSKIIFDLMMNGGLVIEPLISQEGTPELAPEMYKNLSENPNDYIGAIFNWNQ